MTIDNTFMIKKLEKLDTLFVAFSQATRMPYVECDQETFDDQVHVFGAEEGLQAFIKGYAEKKVFLVGVKILQSQAKGFYHTLFAMGVNALMLHEGETEGRIQLSDLIQIPDVEKMKNEKIPVINPALQLTAIYFIQELRRPVKHDMQALHDMEEEMIVNFVKSRFIMGLEMDPPAQEAKDQAPQMKIPYVKDKDGNIFQPIFSDFTEFQKHYKQKARTMRMAPVSIAQLPGYLVKESKGFVINPAGFNLQLSKEQIDVIIKSFIEPELQKAAQARKEEGAPKETGAKSQE